MSISELQTKQNMACVDYTGITVLIAASILTTEYAALYCDTGARNFYMALTAFSGLGGVAFTWSPSFDQPESRFKRLGFFVGFAVAGFLGFFHAAYLHGLVETFSFYFPVFKSLMCYSLGVVVYSFLIPERWLPGSIFDYFGMSHNLWHICVFGGIYYHYVATVHLLEGARHFSCGAHHGF
jgi:adiponectin receptor